MKKRKDIRDLRGFYADLERVLGMSGAEIARAAGFSDRSQYYRAKKAKNAAHATLGRLFRVAKQRGKLRPVAQLYARHAIRLKG